MKNKVGWNHDDDRPYTTVIVFFYGLNGSPTHLVPLPMNREFSERKRHENYL